MTPHSPRRRQRSTDRVSALLRHGLASLALAAGLSCPSAAWAQAPAVQGSWRLDPKASDDVAAQLAAHLDSIRHNPSAVPPPSAGKGGAGGRGGMDGGGRGGMDGGGRDGMGGGGRGAMDTEGVDQDRDDGEGLRELLMGGQQLELTVEGERLLLARDGGDPLDLTIGGKAVRVEASEGHTARVKAWWEGEVLVLRRKDANGRLVEAFLPTDDPQMLYVVVELDSSRMSVPLAFRRVYRAKTSADTPADTPAADPIQPAPEDPAQP